MPPVTATYKLLESQVRQGYKDILSTRAVWSSGATVALNGQARLNFSKGYVQETKFLRPATAPGLAEDLHVAENRERLQQARLQTARQNAAAAAESRERQAQEQQQAQANSGAGLAFLLGAVIGAGAAARSQSDSAPVPSVLVPASSGIVPGFLQTQSTSGMLRYCGYSNGVVNTVGAAELCPLNTQ
jgi:hypothetical protein